MAKQTETAKLQAARADYRHRFRCDKLKQMTLMIGVVLKETPPHEEKVIAQLEQARDLIGNALARLVESRKEAVPGEAASRQR